MGAGLGFPTGWVALICFVIASMLTLLGYGLRQIVKGNLVPRSQVDALQKQYESRLDREQEISALNAKTYDNIVLSMQKTTDQVGALVAEQKTSTAVIVALKQASDIFSQRTPLGGSNQ
jgi:hypothetical protein